MNKFIDYFIVIWRDLVYNICNMKLKNISFVESELERGIELVSVDWFWKKLRKDKRFKVWNDDEVWESVGMDEFVNDVNEMEGKEKGFSEWFWSDWESEVDDGFGGEMLERWVEDCE